MGGEPAIVLGILAVFALPLLLNGVPTVQPRYANFLDRCDAPTAFFDWYDVRVQGANVYAINVPPLTLYGRDMRNRVHYVSPGRHGYYGDQAYTWAELAPLIESEQMDYIVIGFSYPEVMQARLLRDARVEAALDELRQRLTVVYEDEQITVLATDAARTLTCQWPTDPGVS